MDGTSSLGAAGGFACNSRVLTQLLKSNSETLSRCSKTEWQSKPFKLSNANLVVVLRMEIYPLVARSTGRAKYCVCPNTGLLGTKHPSRSHRVIQPTVAIGRPVFVTLCQNVKLISPDVPSIRIILAAQWPQAI